MKEIEPAAKMLWFYKNWDNEQSAWLESLTPHNFSALLMKIIYYIVFSARFSTFLCLPIRNSKHNIFINMMLFCVVYQSILLIRSECPIFQSWTMYSYTVAVTQCIGTVGTWVHICKLPSLNPSWKWIILFFSFSLHKFRNSSIKYATTAQAHTHLSSSFIIIIPISCLMMYKIVSWYSTKNNLTTFLLIILPLTLLQ